jgi:hypothetical protein
MCLIQQKVLTGAKVTQVISELWMANGLQLHQPNIGGVANITAIIFVGGSVFCILLQLYGRDCLEYY